MSDDSPRITKRAAEALKPIMDEAMRMERHGYLQLHDDITALVVKRAALRELLAAWRESQAECEGIQ